jgi:hypothetical protein
MESGQPFHREELRTNHWVPLTKTDFNSIIISGNKHTGNSNFID